MLGASPPKSRRAGVDGGTILRGLPRRPMRLPLVACAPARGCPGCPCFSNPPRGPVCAVDSLLPPSLKRLPPTLIFSDLLPQTLPRRFSCSPTRTFPSSPATKSCPRHPTRHLPTSLKLTRRPPADEIPRDLGLSAASCIRPSTVFPQPWQPSQERCTQHRTAPHLTSPHIPPPSIDLIDDRRLPCSSATFVLRRPRDSLFCPPPPSQRQSDYRISIPR